jgi:hypothetical protein
LAILAITVMKPRPGGQPEGSSGSNSNIEAATSSVQRHCANAVALTLVPKALLAITVMKQQQQQQQQQQ